MGCPTLESVAPGDDEVQRCTVDDETETGPIVGAQKTIIPGLDDEPVATGESEERSEA